MNKISISNILKIKYIEIYPFKRLNEYIVKAIRIVLIHSALLHRSTESLILLNKNDKKLSFSITSNDKTDEVKLSNKMLKLLSIETNRYIAIHNHLKYTQFSLKDISTFLTNSNIETLIVINNNCKEIAIIYKRKATIEQMRLGMKLKVNEQINENKYYRLIQLLTEKYDIEYKEVVLWHS